MRHSDARTLNSPVPTIRDAVREGRIELAPVQVAPIEFPSDPMGMQTRPSSQWIVEEARPSVPSMGAPFSGDHSYIERVVFVPYDEMGSQDIARVRRPTRRIPPGPWLPPLEEF